MQYQDAYELTSVSYTAHHVNLRITEQNEDILSPYFLNWYSKIMRAVADIFFSLGLSVLFLICLPFVWLFNQLFSPGPLFYRQNRVGKNGKVFTIIKFRSMEVDAEPDGIARFTKENDERATAVGSFLRKTRKCSTYPKVLRMAFKHCQMIVSLFITILSFIILMRKQE